MWLPCQLFNPMDEMNNVHSIMFVMVTVLEQLATHKACRGRIDRTWTLPCSSAPACTDFRAEMTGNAMLPGPPTAMAAYTAHRPSMGAMAKPTISNVLAATAITRMCSCRAHFSSNGSSNPCTQHHPWEGLKPTASTCNMCNSCFADQQVAVKRCRSGRGKAADAAMRALHLYSQSAEANSDEDS